MGQIEWRREGGLSTPFTLIWRPAGLVIVVLYNDVKGGGTAQLSIQGGWGGQHTEKRGVVWIC